MIGLVLATSQCPWFNRLRSLADSHLPFASIEETLIRVTGNYLLQQYQLACEGGTPDLAMLGWRNTISLSAISTRPSNGVWKWLQPATPI